MKKFYSIVLLSGVYGLLFAQSSLDSIYSTKARYNEKALVAKNSIKEKTLLNYIRSIKNNARHLISQRLNDSSPTQLKFIFDESVILHFLLNTPYTQVAHYRIDDKNTQKIHSLGFSSRTLRFVNYDEGLIDEDYLSSFETSPPGQSKLDFLRSHPPQYMEYNYLQDLIFHQNLIRISGNTISKANFNFSCFLTPPVIIQRAYNSFLICSDNIIQNAGKTSYTYNTSHGTNFFVFEKAEVDLEAFRTFLANRN